MAKELINVSTVLAIQHHHHDKKIQNKHNIPKHAQKTKVNLKKTIEIDRNFKTLIRQIRKHINEDSKMHQEDYIERLIQEN